MTGYCPDHDPILRATSIACGQCGTGSWPTDAEWITGTLLLATYAPEHEPGCRWRGFPRTVLLDLGQDSREIPRVERPRLCRGTAISTGQQCRKYAQPGSGFCWNHDPAQRGT